MTIRTPQGSGDQGHDFLRAIAAFTEANQSPSSSNKPIKMGLVDYEYNPADFLGGVNPRILFDGESTVSQKRYPVLAGYYPLPGARVVLVPIGTTYLVIGTVETKPQDPKVDIFDAVGNDTWEKPPGARQVKVQVQAGGGAGGGCETTGSGESSGGAGGAGGCYAESTFTANSVSGSVTITVGAGGTANSGASGGSGGSSSFGSQVTASGGSGGGTLPAGSTTTATGGVVGDGQTGVGDLVIKGGGGGVGIRQSGVIMWSGGGGTSFLGTGGRSLGSFTSVSGEIGKGYGGGGGAASGGPNQPARPGGAGAPGVVIVTTFF